MRCLLVGLMMSLLACGIALAQDAPADEGNNVAVKPAEQAVAASTNDVTGIPLYQGPEYRSLESNKLDINNVPPEFHSFHQRPTEEVGYSPLTLADFRYPVAKRVQKEFAFERLTYPPHSVQVWHEKRLGYTVTAFFFTRDMVRDHIQRLIDENYICEPDLIQQVIDYYAEVTPQCGEAISWVWFAVDNNGANFPDRRENRFFSNYLYNFKDKFYLEFGLPKVQDKIDSKVRDFLYQYQDRKRFQCGPQLKPVKCDTCDKCADKASCNECDKCKTATPDCKSCDKPVCREQANLPGDKALLCKDLKYHTFSMDLNNHYLYYPRKVVIEDMTYDPMAQAYRWKFAWRFNDCEVDFLRQLCTLGENVQFALVLSDPHWYGYAPLSPTLKRDILAAMDPDKWGNVWPASKLPFDMSCCPCPLPNCTGNCTPMEPVGWGYQEPVAETPEAPAVTPETPKDDNFNYFPSGEEKKDEVIKVKGKG
jgi:hypothetical protein